MKGWFERGIYFEGLNRGLKGIEDFDLEHWATLVHPNLRNVTLYNATPSVIS